MPLITRRLSLSLNRPPALSISSTSRSTRLLTTTSRLSRDPQFRRSDFDGQGWTSTYEPGGPTVGPLAQSAKLPAPKLTPSMLKEHLDKYVVGQEKAKKVTSVAIFNHYQRIRELKRQDAEEQERWEKQRRWEVKERERMAHPVENEYPGHTEDLRPPYPHGPTPDPIPPPSISASPSITIEKSNLLLLGPSGVGKTHILSTLARVLSVPFTTIDCSSLTQAGYIGTDIETSIERLLLAANHDIAACETGIIFFDELDKLAKPAVMTHGRDVSGEGVQQGLLKMIEGTSVTVTAKHDRNSKSEQVNARGSGGGIGERMERGGREAAQGGMGKSEQFTIDTTNILFVFAGAFVGLEKIIRDRMREGTGMGFGAQLHGGSSSSSFKSQSSNHSSLTSKSTSSLTPLTTNHPSPPSPLIHVTPTDLQTYGLIPELLGRIPILIPLSPLSLPQLVSILTEPANSLIKQYIALFDTYGITLRFTTASLWAVAERAWRRGAKGGGKQGGGGGGEEGEGSGIGARGLRSITEEVLSEIMFWGPGSAIRFVLVDEKFVREQDPPFVSDDSSSSRRGTQDPSTQSTRVGDSTSGGDTGEEKAKMPRCWGRGQGRLMEEAWEREEREWGERVERERRGKEKEAGDRGADGEEEGVGSFERFREVGRSGM